jgi:hypothetical protein
MSTHRNLIDLRAGESAREHGSFPPCQRDRSLLQNFPGAAWGAAIGVANCFHPSVRASNDFETVDILGEFLCEFGKSISRGAAAKHPNINGKYCGGKIGAG